MFCFGSLSRFKYSVYTCEVGGSSRSEGLVFRDCYGFAFGERFGSASRSGLWPSQPYAWAKGIGNFPNLRMILGQLSQTRNYRVLKNSQ